MLRFIICFFVFCLTGVTADEMGSPISGVIIGAFCAFLVFKLMGKKKSTKHSTSVPRHNGSRSLYRRRTDFFDESNLPSFWVRARACDSHDNVTVSQGNASHCHKCGKRFDGSWGDRGIFDGHFCQRHRKWIPLGDYCQKCANEGLINL